MPFAELEIRGEDNRAVPVGTEGEITIRCEGQMTGLWNDPEQTAARLRDGWVLTGDIGRVDEHGSSTSSTGSTRASSASAQRSA
jgi:long-subunit acyl-CoA synthetase (AMP-forming)